MTAGLPLAWSEPRGAATWQAAWENSPALVVVTVGPEFRIVYQNPASREVFGRLPVDVPLAQALPAVTTTVARRFEEVRTSGRVLRFSHQVANMRDAHGGQVVVSYTVSPLGPAVPSEGVVIAAVNVTAEVQAATVADRTRLLADISTAVAGAPDTARGLQVFVDRLVPMLADFAAVYVAEDPELGFADAEPLPPVVISLAAELAGVGPPPPPVRRDEPSPWEPLLRAGQPVVIPVDATTFEALAPDPDAAGWLSATGAHSLAVVPLVVGGQMTGALLLLAAGDRPQFCEVDLPFLTDVAARAGVAMTQQYAQRRQRAVAARLQHALLPPDPPSPPGLSVAASYIAGAPDVEVGGDWWDVHDLGGGRAALGIGDVSGRGVAAAAVMGQARAAMRAASHARLAPAEVLGVLDAQLSDLVLPDVVSEPLPPRFATACYAIVEPGENRLRVANAGHLPLLVRTTDGRVRVVELPAAAPLGLLAGAFTEVGVPFGPGDTVALFTDGLVESREMDLGQGLAALREAFAQHGGEQNLDAVIDRLLDAMRARPGYGDDDVALLLARREAG